MIDPIQAEEDFAVPVLITQEARQIAHHFAQQQPNQGKAQQVRLNTLAICTVNNYLKILSIPSDPSNCDSWNPLMRMTTNTADLEVRGLGRIECRPISAQERTLERCYVPTEVQDDRIAYIVVQVELEQPEALILGFVDQVESETLPLSQLRPITDLPLYLEQWDSRHSVNKVTQLTNWLYGEIEASWQTLENLFGVSPLSYEWRSRGSLSGESPPSTLPRVIRGKVLETPTLQELVTVVLIAELIPKSETDLSVELKITPANEQSFLPVGLEMAVIDAAGEPVMQAQARNENRTIELGFHAEPGDRFSLRIVLGDVTMNELFVV